MDAGDSWWSSSDLRAIDGVAAALTDAGVEVLLLGAEDDDPYAFMHAKLAVRDAEKSGSARATGSRRAPRNRVTPATVTGASW